MFIVKQTDLCKKLIVRLTTAGSLHSPVPLKDVSHEKETSFNILPPSKIAIFPIMVETPPSTLFFTSLSIWKYKIDMIIKNRFYHAINSRSKTINIKNICDFLFLMFHFFISSFFIFSVFIQ